MGITVAISQIQTYKMTKSSYKVKYVSWIVKLARHVISLNSQLYLFYQLECTIKSAAIPGFYNQPHNVFELNTRELKTGYGLNFNEYGLLVDIIPKVMSKSFMKLFLLVGAGTKNRRRDFILKDLDRILVTKMSQFL